MEENQEQFISWLAGKLEATDEEDLKKKVQELGQDGIKQAYDQFLSDSVQQRKEGGKINYLKCLQEFKKGGTVGCGCAGMKLSLKKKKGGVVTKNQQGGKLVSKDQSTRSNTENGQNQMQAMTPEQVQEQKVDKKVLEIQTKKKTPMDMLTPMEILMEQVRPKQIKAKPEKEVRLYFNNDKVLGKEV